MQIQGMNNDVTNLGYPRTWDILRYMKWLLLTYWYGHLYLSFILIGLLVLCVNKGPLIRLVNSPLLTR